MDGEPARLTLVHGGLVGSATWRRPAAALESSARVLTYDLRGYANGDAPAATAAEHARDLIELWNAHGVERGFVAGFSMGGLIAQEVALAAPERVAGLVLVSTAGRVGDPARRAYLERAAEIDAHGLEPSLDALIERMFSSGFREAQPELTAGYRRQVAATSPRAITATFRAVAAYDRLADLGDIRCPVLVVAGDEDAAMGVPAATELRDRIPEASLMVVRGAGHTIHVERPSTFTHLVSDFLAFDGRPPAPRALTIVRSMVLRRYGEPLVLETADVPAPAPGETLIRVEAAALCASDLHAQQGGFGRAQGRFAGLLPPLVLGHQIAGTVVERASRGGDVAIGDRCVVYCYHFCGACRRCLTGRQNVCERVVRRIGFEAPGGFAEYVAVPDQNVVAIPPGLDPAEASVLPDAVATSHHAVRRAGIGPSDAVAVIGVGALGLYAVRLAALRGADVLAVDRLDDERLALARAFGAAATGTALAGEHDVVLDFVGTTETLAAAAEAVRDGGRIVLVGVTGGATLPLARSAERGIEVRTSLASTPADLLDVLALAEAGSIEPVVADRVALEDINAGMERLARGDVVGRLVATPAA